MNISGFDRLIDILGFHLERNVDKHSFCVFSAIVREADLPDYMAKLNADVTVTNAAGTLFKGKVAKVSCGTDKSGGHITVELQSATYFADIEKHRRVFQNPEKTYSDVLKKMDSGYMQCRIGDDTVESAKIPSIITQQDISDYAFYLAISRAVGCRLFYDDAAGGKCVIAKNLGACGVNLSENDYHITEASCETGCERLVVITDKKLEYGKTVSCGGKEFLVSGIIVDKISGWYREMYTLEKREISGSAAIPSIPYVIEATVSDNKDPDKLGRIQVDFTGAYEDVCKESKMWIAISNLYGGQVPGTVFMPDIGDAMYIYIDCDTVYATGAVRKNAIDEKYADPSEKRIICAGDKVISFMDKQILVSYNESLLTVTEDGIEIKAGDSVLYVGKDKVVISSGGTSIDVSNDLLAEAKGRISISGKSGVSLK